MTELWLALNHHLATILLVSVLLAERAFPIPIHLHPFWALRHMAQHIAKRVHPAITRPRSQQRISGLMAMLLLLLLWVAVPALLYWLAELKPWLAAAILWLCLFSQPWLSEATLIQRALQHGQKQLARARLQRWLNRDCAPLSVLGIEKAASEQCVKRQLQAWFGVLFWFVVLGPIAALFYRVCFELNRAWPAQLFYWRDFGAITAALLKLINWPPYLITLAVLYCARAVTRNTTGITQRFSFSYINHHEQQLFHALTQVFPLELGGPVKYNHKKTTRIRFKHSKAVADNRIENTIKYLNAIQCALMVIAVLVTIC